MVEAGPIPPEVVDIGFGWDPTAEIERLLWLARRDAAEPGRVLELGCGTGRLLRALDGRVAEHAGVELNPEFAAYARRHSRADVWVADMSAFDLSREFDLIYTSANTLRYVCDPQAVAGVWRCVARHLAPGGAFIADLELGVEHEIGRLGRPAEWDCSRGEVTVHSAWEVIAPPDPATRLARIEWRFTLRTGVGVRRYRESFPLRTYEAGELIELAQAGGALRCAGLFEPRDPYLFERPTEKAVGRTLVVLRRV